MGDVPNHGGKRPRNQEETRVSAVVSRPARVILVYPRFPSREEPWGLPCTGLAVHVHVQPQH